MVLHDQVLLVHQRLNLALVRRTVRVVVLVPAALQAPAQRLDGLCRFRPHVLHHHTDVPDTGHNVNHRLLGLALKQLLGYIRVHVDLVNTGGVDDCRQGDLAGGVDQEGVSQEDGVKELVNVRPPGVHLRPGAVPGLDVDDHPLHSPEGIVYGKVKLQLLHQKKLVVEDDLGGPLLVALDVCHELGHGHVELLNFTREVDTGDQDLLGVMIHH